MSLCGGVDLPNINTFLSGHFAAWWDKSMVFLVFERRYSNGPSGYSRAAERLLEAKIAVELHTHGTRLPLH